MHSTARAFWSDLHNVAGLWSLWFIFLMVVTGLWYLIEFASVDFGYPELSPTALEAQSTRLSTDELRARAEEAAPELVIKQMYLPGGYYGNVAVAHGEGRAALVRDRANAVMIDAASGATVLNRMAQDLGWPARWIDTADPLHFGNFGGLISKTLWFIFGLLLSGLTLTGAYLHERRQRRHRGEQHRRTGVLIAYLISILVLVAASVGAVQEYPTYAPLPPAPATWYFIGAWIASTIAVLTVWMWKLR